MFTDVQIENINKNWGPEIHARILDRVAVYSAKWKLADLQFFENYSMNAIFFCRSEIYGQCVLKIACGIQIKEFIWEFNILREYDGRGYVKLYEGDEEAMLIERVMPGTQLRAEKDIDKRLAVFSQLFVGTEGVMHIKPKDPSLYKRYEEGLRGNVEFLKESNDNNGHNDRSDLYAHTLKALEMYEAVSATYDREMLLHGDLHYHNILKRDEGLYAIVDPQGRIADPVFDIPRYVLIEYYNCDDEKRWETIEYIINYLAKHLNIPADIIATCFYIETVSFECWWASVGDYTIGNVLFAEKMMNEQLDRH